MAIFKIPQIINTESNFIVFYNKNLMQRIIHNGKGYTCLTIFDSATYNRGVTKFENSTNIFIPIPTNLRGRFESG